MRLTAGKVSKLDFGASIGRVVRIEVNDAAYDGNTLRPQVAERLASLVGALDAEPSIVRLAYAATTESDTEVGERLQVLRGAVEALCKLKACRHPPRIEADIVRSGRASTDGHTP